MANLATLIKEYDSEKDPNGAIGHALAEVAFAKIGYDFNKAGIMTETSRVALRRFPEVQKGETISVKEIKRLLRNIRNIGYPVKPYSEMDKKQAWDYLAQLRKEIREEAKLFCPSALEEIDYRNMQAKENRY